MEYHEIGKTGMKVSSLSFGASSLGGVFHDIKEKEGLEAVFTAIDLGMNFIDVSPYYGHYKAETVLGKALKEIPRDKYYFLYQFMNRLIFIVSNLSLFLNKLLQELDLILYKSIFIS